MTAMMTLKQIAQAEARANADIGYQEAFNSAWVRCTALQEGCTEQAARSWYTKGRVDSNVTADDIPALCATARTALQQRDEAVKWAQHKYDCDVFRLPSDYGGPCTCGLDDFLAAVAQKGGG